jgi:hypothetical protein
MLSREIFGLGTKEGAPEGPESGWLMDLLIGSVVVGIGR